MTTEVCITQTEYDMLKKKAKVADSLLVQIKASTQAIKEGKIKRVR